MRVGLRFGRRSRRFCRADHERGTLMRYASLHAQQRLPGAVSLLPAGVASPPLRRVPVTRRRRTLTCAARDRGALRAVALTAVTARAHRDPHRTSRAVEHPYARFDRRLLPPPCATRSPQRSLPAAIAGSKSDGASRSPAGCYTVESGLRGCTDDPKIVAVIALDSTRSPSATARGYASEPRLIGNQIHRSRCTGNQTQRSGRIRAVIGITRFLVIVDTS